MGNTLFDRVDQSVSGFCCLFGCDEVLKACLYVAVSDYPSRALATFGTASTATERSKSAAMVRRVVTIGLNLSQGGANSFALLSPTGTEVEPGAGQALIDEFDGLVESPKN